MSNEMVKKLLDVIRQITIAFEVITPEVAKQLLDRNFKLNRKPAKSRIAKYRAEMSAGRWAPISVMYIGPQGELWDGQHRCLACIESGTPFVALVLRNVPFSYVSTLDQGFKRTPGARLKMHTSGRFSDTEAGPARILHALKRGNAVESSVSSEEIEVAALDNEAAIVWLRTIKHKLPDTFEGAVTYAHKAFPKEVNQFATMVSNEAGYEKNTPAWRLVQFFKNKAQGDSDRATQVLRTLEELRNFIEGKAKKANQTPVIEWWQKSRNATEKK